MIRPVRTPAAVRIPAASSVPPRRPGAGLAISVVAAVLAAGCSPGTGGAGSAGGGERGAAVAAARGTYAFWPQAPDEPRVQFVRALKSTEDVSQRQTSGFEKMVFGREAEPTDVIVKPYGVAMRAGRIYVCDIRGAGVTVLDLAKRQTRVMGQSGSNPVKRPVAVAIAEDGEIYVADNDAGAVYVFDASERFSRVYARPGSKPAGVAAHGDRLYVTDIASQSVLVLDRRTGKQVGTIGSVGDEDGQFRLPLGVAADSKGNVWVSDMMRCRVQKFGPDGRLITALGSMGDFRGSFARPKHIAVDADDVLYVVDAAFQNVQMFDAENRVLMHFGAAGAFPGAMNLPAGICVSDDSVGVIADRVHPGFAAKRVVVVTNQFGGEKVSLYAMGGLRPGVSVADVRPSAAAVHSGTDADPSAERLKLQTPGDQEPAPPEPAAGDGAPAPTKPPK